MSLAFGFQFFFVGSSRQALLVLLSLRVGQIVGFIAVQSETEFALVATQVVADQIWIFGQIDRFQRQLLESLLALALRLLLRRLSPSTEFAPDAILSVHAAADSQAQLQETATTIGFVDCFLQLCNPVVWSQRLASSFSNQISAGLKVSTLLFIPRKRRRRRTGEVCVFVKATA